MTNPNDTAFPQDAQSSIEEGLTKREYFAAMAMQSIAQLFSDANECANYSLKLADALIIELSKEK